MKFEFPPVTRADIEWAQKAIEKLEEELPRCYCGGVMYPRVIDSPDKAGKEEGFECVRCLNFVVPEEVG